MAEFLDIKTRKVAGNIMVEIHGVDEWLLDKDEAHRFSEMLISAAEEVDYYMDNNALKKSQLDLIEKAYKSGYEDGDMDGGHMGVSTTWENFKSENNLQ